MFLLPGPDYFSFLDRLLWIGGLSLINIVPEFGESSLELIKIAVANQLVVGCGHTRCTAEQLAKAISLGAKYFVHFANGPTGQSWKPFDGGGAFEGGLTLPITIELIVILPITSVLARR